jgi:hypothetical protein
MSAFAAGLVQISAQPGLTRARASLLLARIMVVSLALTGAVSWVLVQMLNQALSAFIPVPVALSLVSFLLGLADGNWQKIAAALGSWLMRLLPERKQ